MPPESQVHRQVVRKRAETHPIEIDPVVRLYYVEVAEPDMHDPSSDFRRLQQALREQWGLAETNADLATLAGLQRTLRAGGWKVTAALRKDRDIVAVMPGFTERAYGVAIDVGSTTIAAHLCDLMSGEVVASCGAMNPQIRFGEDLMSRVSYVMMNPGGDKELTRTVREAMDNLIGEAAREAGVARSEILEVTLVGNPIMHHLVLGLDPTELGGAPFALTIDGAYEARARELGLDVAPGAFVYALPCIAGHVGADTAGVVLSEGPHLKDELTLLVDVGTNAEIVFGDRERLLACSSPTGPAFEGAQVSCGQRAAPGAIERVRIDRATLEPRFKVIGCDHWSDEPGFAEASANLGVTGVCGSGIIEAIAEMFLAGIVSEDGVIDGELAERTKRVEQVGRTFAYVLSEGAPRLLIYQTDVRAIQLAKAALYAGAKLLIGARRRRARARHPRRRLRQPHRSPLRDDARPHPRLRSLQGGKRRQRRGNRRPHRASQSCRAGRDRGRRQAESRRSRPRSSPPSSAISSPQWRFPTRRTPFRIWPSASTCRRARRRQTRAAEGGGARRRPTQDSPVAAAQVDRSPRAKRALSPSRIE